MQSENPLLEDEILASVLSTRSGYVQGKGYGKRLSNKEALLERDVEANVSSAIDSVHEEMQAEMDRRLKAEREEINKILVEEQALMRRDIRAQLGIIRPAMQQVLLLFL